MRPVCYTPRMDHPTHPQILLDLRCRDTAKRLADVFRAQAATIWTAREQLPAGQTPDIILTDAAASDWGSDVLAATVRIVDEPLPDEPPPDGATFEGQDVDEPEADDVLSSVWLPRNVSARELTIVGRLLAEIVRLRRREHAEAELRQKLVDAAQTDPLTGLANRRAWDATLSSRTTDTATAMRLCLAILDLDHFKRVNDEQGHDVGDRVLRAVGQTIRHCLRTDDFVARLGGDEFGLLLWIPDETTARLVLDRVREGIARATADASATRVTASAGFALTPADSAGKRPVTPDSLFTAADAALRTAKQQGRNRLVSYYWFRG